MSYRFFSAPLFTLACACLLILTGCGESELTARRKRQEVVA